MYFALALLIGLLDAVGISLFIPLLETFYESSSNSRAEGVAIFELFDKLGFSLNSAGAIFLTMFSFYSIKGLLTFIQVYYDNYCNQLLVKYLRIGITTGIRDSEYIEISSMDLGTIQNTTTTEVERTSASFRLFMQMVQQIALILAYFSLALLTTVKFTLFVAGLGLLANLMFRIIYKKTKAKSKALVPEAHRMQGMLVEFVSNYKYLKATGVIIGMLERLQQKINNIYMYNLKIGLLNGIVSGLREPILMGIILVMIFVEIEILGGSITVIFLSLLLLYKALGAVSVLQTNYNGYLSFSGSLEEVMNFYAIIVKEENPGTISKEEKSEVSQMKQLTLRDISFSYKKGKPILDRISGSIMSGEHILIYGESGSGKSTLLNIITGLIGPNSGKIEWNNTAYSDLGRDSLANKVGYITQEPIVFADTVFNNVTCWDEITDKSLSRFWKSIERAHLTDIIKALPDRENTLMTHQGGSLSGGQRQRLAIARELYKKVDILVMDEATSALDSETRHRIDQTIAELNEELTIITVSHHGVKKDEFDQVWKIDNGKLIREY